MSITLDNVGSGFKRSVINDNFQLIEDELNNETLKKDGSVALTGDLNAGGLNVYNVGSLQASLVEAGDVLVNGTSAQGLDTHQKVFSTVAVLKAATDFIVGERVQTLGYYAAGDGGGASYLVEAPQVVDGYGDHSLADSNTAILQPTTKETVNVLQYGATGDGSTDDTTAIQAAIDSGAGHVYFPAGTYLIERSTSVDGHTNYGIQVNRSDLTLSGVKGATKLKRYSPDISTYALAYPLFHVGSIEINNPAIASNIVFSNLDFYGNDTRHTVSGNSPGDFRCAVHVKSAIDLECLSCTFWDVDSSAIFFTPPKFYSYVSSTQLNTNTYSENAVIDSCTFWGKPHTTTGRALIHAIQTSGVDSLRVVGNHFSWCDDAVSGVSTFDVDGADAPRRVSTYLDGGINYLRCGRNMVISNNQMVNSSEHSIYVSMANTTITGNSISVDNDYCYGGIKIRGSNTTVSNNVVVTNKSCITIAELSRDVSVTGNTLFRRAESSAGVVDISSAGILGYVNDRPFFTTSPTNYPRMENIVVADNIIKQKDVTKQWGYAIRLYTDTSSITEYPEWTLHNITISNNVVENAKVGILSQAPLMKNVKVDGNTFRGGSFTSASFDGTDLQGYAPIVCADKFQYNLLRIEYSNNKSVGFKYVMGILDTSGNAGGGQAGLNYRPPRVFANNTFDYALDLSEAYGVGYWSGVGPECQGNKGSNLLARNSQMDQQATNNSIGIVGLSSSANRGKLFWDGTNLRYYTDDTGTFITL